MQYSRGQILVTLCALVLLSRTVLAEPLPISITESFKPYSFTANGEATGIDHTISLEMFTRMGIEVSYTAYPWTRQLARSEQGLDAGVLTTYCEDERPFFEKVDEPFYPVKISLFAKNNRFGSKSFRSFKELPEGARIGIVRGNHFGDFIDPSIPVELSFNVESKLLIKQLYLDRLDFVLEEFLPFMYLSKDVAKPGEFKEVLTVKHHNVCAAFSKAYFEKQSINLAELIERSKQVIKQLKAEGFIDKAIRQYID